MNNQHDFAEERVEIQRMIDRVCDKLESMWDAGETPNIAEHVNAFDDDSVPGLLAEIMKSDREINALNRSQLREKYVRAIPQHEETIDAILKSLFAEQDAKEDSEHQTVRGGMGPSVNRDRDFVGEKIGDYLVVKKIGEGTFGIVYLARDMILGRDIVIKIPRRNANFRQEDVDFFLDEARNSCFLHHEYILRVLHVGMHQGLPYIVQDYFEGGDLRKALEGNSYSIEATVEFVRKVSEAIGYAHQFRIIHRDLKPANILIKQNGDPVVADFGLAIRDPHLRGKAGEIAGTIQYMSPEQVRGETHRLDGRSDVWSIGVILYLMLVGRMPFEGEGLDQIRDAILFGRPTPPRQLNEKISKELNRICLKCLALRVNDRYLTALDLADDLRELTDSTPVRIQQELIEAKEIPQEQSVAVVPKGLMAFDKNDSQFFLELLPGPHDREGIPECIHFWKNRIEDPLRSHPVGLIYGPSGCGKSSLVSAGLLPLLADDILVVHIESTPNDTEVRLFKALRAAIPSIPEDPSLPDVVAGIRLGDYLPRDKRLLIVFDQFEQWLHANTIDEHSQLIDALRQCDGKTVQALILVRDDFWMGISRFFRQLEIELIERQNFASVDLFSKRHAKDVLIKFGQAYGTLPMNEDDLSARQQQFLEKAIDMIAENDSVICVRSVLFAETVKNQPWEVETLRKIGDSKSIGIVFLEQVLGEGASNPKYRYHRKSLLAVLESLLPDEGVEIKGNLRSRHELAEAAQLNPHHQDFETVLHILDNELRLITPTEPDTGRQIDLNTNAANELEEDGSQSDTSTVKITSWYQLTHDYLVPSLRSWMQNVRGRTRHGRAKLRLNSLANQWQTSGQARFLPSFFEYCSIAWNVPRNQRNGIEIPFMKKANLFYGLRAALVVVLACLALMTWWNVVENNRRIDTQARVSQFLTASPSSVPIIVEGFLRPNKVVAVEELKSKLAEGVSDKEKARIFVGLASLDALDDYYPINGVVDHLLDYATDCDRQECSNLVTAFSSLQKNRAIEWDVGQVIQKQLEATDDDDSRARLQILQMFLQPDESPMVAFKFRSDPSSRSKLIQVFRDWHGDLNQMPQMLNRLYAKQDPVGDTLSGLCICLGRIERESFERHSFANSNLFEALSSCVKQCYSDHPSAAVQGASRWALTNWSVGSLPKRTPAANAQWWVNKLGMTMVRVKGNGIVDDFSISACEINYGQYQAFLDDVGLMFEKTETWNKLHEAALAKDVSVAEVNFEDAVLFCNWLSKKHGLAACYEPTGKELTIMNALGQNEVITEWKLNPAADGYRLPWTSEWELAARGGPENGCLTRFYFGDRESSVDYTEYVWCAMNSGDSGTPIVKKGAQKIPNQLGLFDMLGNLIEMCSQGPSSDGSILDSKDRIKLRGGHYNLNVGSMKIQSSIPATVGKRRHPLNGFRVVRSSHRSD